MNATAWHWVKMSILAVSILGLTTKAWRAAKGAVLTHDQFMLQMTLNDKEAARYTAMAVCLKRNTPKACAALP